MSIELKGVTKKFGKNTVLKAISLKFDEKKIYGLLGRNGAGKSTMLNIISNRLYQNDGEALVDGESACENPKIQGKIFLMSEKNLYPSTMKISDMISWTAKFYPETNQIRAEELAKKFELDLKKSFGSLSTGYRTIAKFIMAIASNAKYTFLDEPVLGLDAGHRELLYKIILEEYSSNPRTIVIATHLIDEITSLLEEVIILKEGEIIESCSIEQLLSKGYTATGNTKLIDSFIKDKTVMGTDELGAVKIAYILGKNNVKEIPEGIEITSLNLQKLFIKLTGETEEKQ